MLFSQTDAALILGAFTSLIVPLVYAWAKSNVLAEWVKFMLVCTTCAIGGFLTSYAGGQLVTGASVVEYCAKIAVPASAIYIGVFRGLGLERVLFPRASVISDAQQSVARQIGMLSHDTIRDVSDPTSDSSLRIDVNQVKTGIPSGPVLPAPKDG